MKIRMAAVMLVVVLLGCDTKTETRKPSSAGTKPAASLPMVVVPAQSGFPNWVKVEAKSSGSMTAYLDASSVSNEGAYRRVWSLFDYDSEQDFANSGIKHRSVKRFNLYSCQDKKSTYAEAHYYKENMGRGVVVHKQKVAELKWFPTPPGSLAEATMEAACKMTPNGTASGPEQQPAQAAAAINWALAGNVQGGKIYINESSVVNFDKYKKVMTLIDYDKAQTANNKKKYFSVNAYHMFSCSDKKYWIGAPRFHSGKMGGGDQFVVDSKLDYVDVPTIGGIATIFQRVCR